MKSLPLHAGLGSEPDVAGSRINKKQESWRSVMAAIRDDIRSDARAVSEHWSQRGESKMEAVL